MTHTILQDEFPRPTGSTWFITCDYGWIGYPEKDKPSTYSWYASWYTSVKSIIIRKSEAAACHTPTCIYYIGVYGVSNSSYALVAASSSATIPLVPGIIDIDISCHRYHESCIFDVFMT
jgi:hypothetical protein